MKQYRAFTLIEVLLAMAIVTSISVFAVPTALSSVFRANSDSSAEIVSSGLFTQQQNAYTGYQGNNYGVYLTGSSITLYTGNSYAQATSTRVLNLSGSVLTHTLSGSDINFNINSLFPSDSGTIYLSSGGFTTQVIINQAGNIYIQK